MIEVEAVTKRYGDTLAVDELSFSVPPGRVTGFLGPNGAGKSTTMRLIIGLDAPTKGHIRVNGRRYGEHRFPLREVGALLEAKAIHPGRSARSHLRWLADSNRISRRRVDEVLEQVGLTDVARRRAGSFSLGMGQRLGIAAALLGDPGIVLLDEPVNGLDPEGIQWVRGLLRSLAQEGRTVLVSSHLMAEMAQTADHLLIVGRGRLIADATVEEVIRGSAGNHVVVRSPEIGALEALLRTRATTVVHEGDALVVSGLECKDVGTLAAGASLTLYELSPRRASLEEAFMEMTKDSSEFQAHPVAEADTAEGPPR